MFRRASHEHGGGDATDGGITRQAFLVAKVEAEAHDHNVAARLFRDHRKLQPARRIGALRPLLDVFR